MSNIRIEHKEVANFLSLFSDALTVVTYNGSKLEVECEEGVADIEAAFEDVTSLPNGNYEIKLSSVKFTDVFFFFEIKDFLQKYDRIKDRFDSVTIVVLLDNNSYLYKAINDTSKESNRVIFNIHEYKLVLNYFLSTPDFTPYIDELGNRLTIISKTHGVFNIGYKLPEISFFKTISLTGLSDRIRSEFEKKEYVQFFKEILINAIHNTPEEGRYNTIIKEHNSLLNLATRDYETYVSNFGFDKIKSEFKEEREKYFESIDKNISSIGKQVVSFPLTFGATIFASYKVKDKPEFLVLILAGYFLYTIIAFLILKMTSYNVKCLREDIKEEKDIIKKSYKIVFDEFKPDFKKIENKIFNLRTIIVVLFIVLILLFLLFAIYTLHHLDVLDISNIFNNYS